MTAFRLLYLNSVHPKAWAFLFIQQRQDRMIKQIRSNWSAFPADLVGSLYIMFVPCMWILSRASSRSTGLDESLQTQDSTLVGFTLLLQYPFISLHIPSYHTQVYSSFNSFCSAVLSAGHWLCSGFQVRVIHKSRATLVKLWEVRAQRISDSLIHFRTHKYR